MASPEEKFILVVDDEPDVRAFLAAMLEDVGFEVDEAENGEVALEKVKSRTPDLITLDMVMPRKSGIQFMRELRAESKWKDIPVIVITAHASDEFGSKDVKELTAFDTRTKPRVIVEKPIKPIKLVEAVGQILKVEINLEDLDARP